jgi:dihydrodipicolinate synthase/N-acetylneuraminate lyase
MGAREPAASPLDFKTAAPRAWQNWRERLLHGAVIPAHPLALTAQRKLDERRQRALTRYYLAAGAGGVAVGVHTTQFAIRDFKVGLLKPVLQLAIEEMMDRESVIRVAGICGDTEQAVAEAGLARDLGYHAGLLSLAALKQDPVGRLIEHAREVAAIIPIFGFYLQPAVGGRILPFEFWRRFVEIDSVVAVKVAPFNRYQTLEVARALAESGRVDIALYTGNDDNIVVDLLTRFNFNGRECAFAGGLLGHWAAWTRCAVALLDRLQHDPPPPPALLTLAAQVTDSNAALFDAANQFHGCIAGIHEVLRRQGLLAGRWCLDPNEDLSPGQMEEIDRVYSSYPFLTDDAFVRQHLDDWLR